MDNNPIFKSKSRGLRYIPILLIGGVGAGLACFFLIKSALKAPYIQIAPFILGVFFGSISLISFIAIFQTEKVYVYKNRLEVKSLFGHSIKTIYLDEIKNWKEENKGNSDILTVFTNNKKYSFLSDYYSDYDYEMLKSLITDGVPIKNEPENKHTQLIVEFIVLAFLILFFGYVTFAFYKKTNFNIHSNTNEIIGTITEDAKISTSGKGHKSISFNLKEFPKYTFSISGVRFEATFIDDYLNNIRKGDTLYLTISTDDYLEKIKKIKEPNFKRKHINYSFIGVYQLKDKNKAYISIEYYNLKEADDNKLGLIIFAILTFSTLGFLIYRITKKYF